MNLKLKRLVRTTHSEQYALFDLDQSEADGSPRTVGKLDLHYTSEGMYGTLLLWDAAMRTLRPRTRRAFVHALLREIAQPMGVPNEYVVEFFAPTLDQYEVFHNVTLDDEGEGGEAGEDGFAAVAVDDEEGGEESDEEGGEDGDAFAAAEDGERIEPLPPSMSEPPPVRRFAPRPRDAS